MSAADEGIWQLVGAERRALVDDLSTLTEQQWQTPSLSQGWQVHDVAAHLVGNAQFGLWATIVGIVRHRFDFDAMNQADTAARRRETGAQTLADLAAVTDLRVGPPVAKASRLVEEIAHGEDIRRPLGITRQYPIEAILPALTYQLNTSDKVGGAKRLLGSVQLVASDAEFSHGTGPQITGPALELLLLASGRGAHARGLSGEGLAQLG